jgi:hypothetical protein
LYLVLAEPQIALTIDDEYRWNLLRLRCYELQIVKAFEVFRARGIEPILFKGWAASRYYPAGRHRAFADIDLAVSRDDYAKGYELTHTAPLNTINIDIHRELRHLDVVLWKDLFDRSETVPIDDTFIRILSPEDHLRVLCSHWLTDGGQYRERLWDIYYAIENGPECIDWDLCLGSVPAVRRNWVLMTIAITRKYLNLDVSNLPIAHELPDIPKWIDRCLEKEWSSDVRLRSLHTCLNDRKLLVKQIKKRVPPNPIQATIESEEFFDEGSRLPMQLKSVMLRISPSISRVGGSILEKLWRKAPN